MLGWKPFSWREKVKDIYARSLSPPASNLNIRKGVRRNMSVHFLVAFFSSAFQPIQSPQSYSHTVSTVSTCSYSLCSLYSVYCLFRLHSLHSNHSHTVSTFSTLSTVSTVSTDSTDSTVFTVLQVLLAHLWVDFWAFFTQKFLRQPLPTFFGPGMHWGIGLQRWDIWGLQAEQRCGRKSFENMKEEQEETREDCGMPAAQRQKKH